MSSSDAVSSGPDERGSAGPDERGSAGPDDSGSARPDRASGEHSLVGESAEPPSTADLLSYGPGSGRRLNYTSAVYGSVLAATVVVSSGDLRAPVVLAVLLLVSGLTFWIAHVYAATVAGVHGGWNLGSIWSGMRHEWPVAFAAVPPAAAALICGLVPGVTVTEGVWAALIVCIVEQQLWGYAAVRSAKLTGQALTRTVLLNVVMGFIIVALKLGVGGH